MPDMEEPGHSITLFLEKAAHGDAEAAEKLLVLLYDELRTLARRQVRPGDPGHTLQPTSLVHEAFARLLGEEGTSFKNRAYFFGAAAQAMRRILVERSRRALRQKRGGGQQQEELREEELERRESRELVALDEAMGDLLHHDARKHEIVMLRSFAGLTIEETAQVLGISSTTVSEEWRFARLWLKDQIEG